MSSLYAVAAFICVGHAIGDANANTAAAAPLNLHF